MNTIKVGLFGALINNDNMGCCALTYGIISLLETIAQRNKINFKYLIFERNPSLNSVQKLIEQLNLKQDQIISCQSVQFIRFYNFRKNKKCVNAIQMCDFVIDITQGDSFTDIYGLKRFISYTLEKLIVEKKEIPLILGPQTYGPFNKKISKYFARKAINQAYAVFSRDQYSIDYLKNELSIKNNIIQVTDLAFCLPYNIKQKNTNKIAGVNVSGLLWPNKYEETTKKFELKCDYKELMIKMIDYLLENNYEVHLISHVGADYNACIDLNNELPNTKVVPCFDNPVDAKSYIASTDLFIGARMHATIAALSSKVPVIPIAYSRKFKGLFNNLNYDVCVDLLSLNTNDSIDKVKEYINDIEKLKENIAIGSKNATEKYIAMVDKFENVIMKIINNK